MQVIKCDLAETNQRSHARKNNSLSTYLENATRETSRKCNAGLGHEIIPLCQLFDHEEPKNKNLDKYTTGLC